MPSIADSLSRSLSDLGADGYIAGTVAWNDGARGASNGVLSALGRNITDARIVARDGAFLPFVRPDNYDELVGVVRAADVGLVEADGTPVSLQAVLDDLPARCAYRGLTVDAKAASDERVVFRVQSAWVPVGAAGTREVAPAHYSYQTRDAANPRNLILVGTPEGLSVHTDAPGIQPLLAHARSPDEATVTTRWYAAAPSAALVGEAEADGAPGAVAMGLRGMGRRANCFVVVSVPHAQAPAWTTWGDDDDDDDQPVYRSLGAGAAGESRSARMTVAAEDVGVAAPCDGLHIDRPAAEPIVVTLLLFQTVSGDPTAPRVATADVGRAVTDMERVYALARTLGGHTCRLSHLPAMLHTLTPDDVRAAKRKREEDPPVLVAPGGGDPMAPTPGALAHL